jgi:flagellar hook-length control protein FliK
MRQNGGSLTLRLKPESLGAMTIRMDLQPGQVAASFEVQSDQARELLNGNMTSLRSALEAKGLNVDSLTVHVSDRAALEALAQGAGSPAEPGINPDGGAGNHHGGATRQDARSGTDRPEARIAESLTSEAGTGIDAGVESGGAHTVRLVLDAVA